MDYQKKLAIMVVAMFLVLAAMGSAFAQTHIELTPSISVSETYDDNIYLDPDNETSDYISEVTPRLSLAWVKQHTRLELAYSPSFVWYKDETDNNTVRHEGTVTFGHQLARYLRFDLNDTFYRTEEPIEESESIIGIRHTRRNYWRNTGEARVSYQFGGINNVALGYRQEYLENQDPTVDDGREQSPFGEIMFWLNTSNGIQVHYEYNKADFWRQEGVAGDDYTGSTASAVYLRRFGPHITSSLGYAYTVRDFNGSTEDYKVHQGALGYEQIFSPNLNLALEMGYFVRDNDYSDNDSGYVYRARITRRMQRTTITVSGSGGWGEAYLESERPGFTKYWSASARIEHQLAQPLSCYMAGSYRSDKDNTARRWRTSSADLGLDYSFLRWFTAGLSYRYSRRNDDVNTDDYTDNQVMLTLTTSKMFRW